MASVLPQDLQKYQYDSYLKEFDAVVISCEEVEIKEESNKKKKKNKNKSKATKQYKIVLNDTILFAEGGGQPTDTGLMNNAKVFKVNRDSNGVVTHYVDSAFNPGETVHLVVDWERRFDHMQQHTSQHLISALAENHFGWNTTTWWLGQDKCNIEFDVDPNFESPKPFNQESLDELEEMANDVIRKHKCIVVNVEEHSQNENNDESNNNDNDGKVDRKDESRHHGKLRIIEIEGIDKNPCCGTHVSSLAHLQLIKFIGFERARGGDFRIFFLSGNRTLERLGSMWTREQELKKMLSANENDVVNKVEKIQNDLKAMSKVSKQLNKYLTIAKAKQLISEVNSDKPFITYSEQLSETFNNQYMIAIGNNIQETHPDMICLFILQKNKNEGNFIIFAKSLDNAELKGFCTQVQEKINGRGGGKSGRWQGKAKNLSNVEEANQVITEYLENKNNNNN
eukprot:TRINITY_DN7573_c3_g1_i1.p1 TRINITY_DN7573_c3_g1~~TRINITY_DN7573_c3_g1_i1.p1  ORF type:complete len:453 (+),score=156.32 TRINITY_DN7573_c3_g1_i1:58-1416(+)